jgi:hypothetical protein
LEKGRVVEVVGEMEFVADVVMGFLPVTRLVPQGRFERMTQKFLVNSRP